MASKTLRSLVTRFMAFACACAFVGMPAVGVSQDVTSPPRVASADRAGADATRVSLDVVDTPLVDVLVAIAAQGHLRPAYDKSIIPAKRVTLHVHDVSIGTAFQQALRGTGFSARIQPTGSVLVVSDTTGAAAGIVTGHVTDGRTKRPLPDVRVWLDDSAHAVRTDDAGRFRFAGVSVGTHRLLVRAVGFARQTRVVTVVDDQTTTMDFTLASSVNTLDQVVVTATGAQRVRELGHVVSQINADSLVKEAPVSSLSELLTARVPGLAVYTGNGGVVGGDVALRLRGTTTANLDPQPIVIVDGVRYKSASRTIGDNNDGAGSTRPFGAEPRSPLNDLNVNDIATIDVVKGPSASTLYGPDAANGVIVITTKRGTPGKAVWHVYAYPDLATQPKTAVTASSGYRAWGHDPSTGETVNYNCDLLSQVEPARCLLDSITIVSTASNDPQYSVLAKNRPQWHSGANVGGGTQGLTYFFSGNYDSEIGSLQVSPLAANILKAQLGRSSLSDAIRNPNTQQTFTMHSDLSAQVNAVSTLNLMLNYTQVLQRAVGVSFVYGNTYGRGVLPLGVDTTNLDQLSNTLPTYAFLNTTQLHLHRWTVAMHGATRPFDWLTATAEAGTDLSSSIDRALVPPGEDPNDADGQIRETRQDNTGRSASVGLTALAHPGRLSFRTSLGAQYTYSNLDGANLVGYGLTPGSNSIATAQLTLDSPDWAETASLGTYGEEVVGLNDRLFLTASLRLDGSTTFGDAYHPRPFPKAGVSWIVSDEPLLQRIRPPGLTDLRLRYSYGAASRYPTSLMKYGQELAGSTNLEGNTVALFTRALLANPQVRPERTRESEWGADATVVNNVQIGLTWYNRRTIDQLNTLTVPYRFLSQWANVGDLAANGFEATLNAKVIESARIGLDLNASYAHNTSKVVSLGSATGFQTYYGSLVAGYPLDASFGESIASVNDLNGDGIIGSGDEVTLTPVHYLGVFFAPNVYTFTPVLSLFGATTRVSALFDRQTGGVQVDYFTTSCGGLGLCVAPYLKSTPLLEQARVFGYASGANIVSSDFTRWRELSVTTDLPRVIRQPLQLSRASVSLQVRNLKLWTNFQGPDPESIPGLGTLGIGSANTGATGIPQGRSWTVRFDLSP